MAPIGSFLIGLSSLSGINAVKLFAAHFSGQVYTLDLALSNTTSAGLSIASRSGGCGVTPAWLHLDKTTQTLYCIDESWQGRGVLSQYSINPNSGALTSTGSASTAGNSVFGSTYGGPDGRSFIITAEYTPSTITTYKLPLTPGTKPLQKLQFTMNAPGPRPDRQDKPHPHAAFTDPTGSFMLVPDLGADLTRIFRIDRSTGQLTPCPAIPSLPGDGPRHGAFHRVAQDAWKYYSLNEVSSSVGVYDVSYPKATGGNDACLDLTLGDTLSTYGPSVPLGNVSVKAAELRIAGSFLYASNRNDSTFGFEQDSIATYAIGAGGSLTFVGLENAHGYYPRSFEVSGDGGLVAIAGQTTAGVVVVERDEETGRFGNVVARVGIPPRGTYGGEDGLSAVVWGE